MGLKVGRTYTGNKVPKLTKFLYPFVGIFRDACYALVGSFLLQYAINTGVLSSNAETFKAQYAVITIAMMIALVWDGINDPIMGFIVEKVHFKAGKFKPWILIGAIGNAVAVLCMFLIRPGSMQGGVWVADGWAFVVCMIVFYFIWDLFFTMNDIGYWSMLPSLSNDEHERATLTSRVTIFASIGGFLMTACGMLLPTMISGVSSGQMFGYMAIAVAVLFLISQIAVFFLCQEKERDAKQEEASEQSHFLDLFKVVIKNPQVRVAVIAMFLYYLASGVLTGGIGLNYFYLSIGYGSGRGGLVSTIISIMYVLGMVISQALYPVIAKKMSKQKILTIFFAIQMAAYIGFLICCVPLFGSKPIANNPAPIPDMNSMDFGWAFGGTMSLYYIFPFIFFFGEGMVYMVILMMLQDAIDYNEWKFGERKESIISSWRPLDVKLSSAMLRGFQYLIFLVAGVMGATTAISNAESAHNTWAQSHGAGETDTEFINAINAAMNMVGADNIRIFGILVVALLALSMLAAYLILHFGYKIDETQHKEIVAELESRRSAAPVETPAE